MSSRNRAVRPAYLQPRLIGVVALGGTVGTAARMAVAAITPAADLPLATLTVNVTGAFALGALLAALAAGGPDTGHRRTARLLLGAGFLGGFTTYSQLALDIVRLAAGGAAGAAWLYGGLTLTLGIGAAAAGAALVGRRRDR